MPRETERISSMAKMESVRNANGDYGVDNTCTVGKERMFNTDEDMISISVNVSLLYCKDIVCYWCNLCED